MIQVPHVRLFPRLLSQMVNLSLVDSPETSVLDSLDFQDLTSRWHCLHEIDVYLFEFFRIISQSY